MKIGSKSFIAVFGFAALIFIIAFAISNKGLMVAGDDQRYLHPKKIRYGFTITNRTGRAVKNAEFLVYIPLDNTSTQLCTKISASLPGTIIKDDFGNRIMSFNFDNFSPYATKIININADLLLSNKPGRLKINDQDKYFGPEKYIESEHPAIIRLAGALKAKSEFQTAENIFMSVSKMIKYAGYVKNDRY